MNLIAFPAIKIADEGVSRFDLIVMKIDENGLNISLHDGFEIIRGETPKIFYTTRKTIRDGIKSGKLTIIDIKPFMRIGEMMFYAAEILAAATVKGRDLNQYIVVEYAKKKYFEEKISNLNPNAALVWKLEENNWHTWLLRRISLYDIAEYITEYTNTRILEIVREAIK
jgi:hypothetical protein